MDSDPCDMSEHNLYIIIYLFNSSLSQYTDTFFSQINSANEPYSLKTYLIHRIKHNPFIIVILAVTIFIKFIY